MKTLTGFLKTTIVGGALYLVPIVVILAVLGKVHGVTSKLITPMTEALELHDVGDINVGLFARTRIAPAP